MQLDVSWAASQEQQQRFRAETIAAVVRDQPTWTLAGEVSATARTIHGLREFSELPPLEAAAAYDARVRRYAAYQRKWMRRIPGIRMVDATRATDAVATEIVAMAG